MSKFLYQPVSPFSINQNFGGNLPCTENIPTLPLDQRKVVTGASNTTCPVGYIKLYPLLGLPQGHNGADLQAYHGQPVYSSADGTVYEVQTEPERGLGLGIVTQEKYLCNETNTMTYFKVRYWHLKSFNVKMGDFVKRGDLIGWADNTGYSSGDHLHWECKPVSDQVGFSNVLQNNGFYGSVDPIQYMVAEFANISALPPATPVAMPKLKDFPSFFSYAGALTRWIFKKQNGYDEPTS